MLHGVILSGGSGERFWPLSRAAYPKQFLTLQGERTLLQATRDRCSSWIPDERLWVVTNQQQAAEVQRQLSSIPEEHILAEPVGRNTAAAIGWAAVCLLAEDPDAVMVVMPADHVIQNTEDFQSAIQHAACFVTDKPEALFLFGIPPTTPATGYGYIKLVLPQPQKEGLHKRKVATAEPGIPNTPPMPSFDQGQGRPADRTEHETPRIFQVESFHEKPTRTVAERYLEQGSYLWNCGLFVWRADTILSMLKCLEPELHQGLMEIAADWGSARSQTTLQSVFPGLKAISIDHAILEKADSVYVMKAEFDWDDLGSYSALARLHGSDSDGNTFLGDVCSVETRHCLVSSSEGHLIATSNVEGLVIVHTPDVTLVARQDDEDGLRKLVQRLRDAGYEDRL